jgi:betaine lipid synthase
MLSMTTATVSVLGVMWLRTSSTSSVVGVNNPYYHVCMTGAFTRRCHPDYLSEEAYAKLSSRSCAPRVEPVHAIHDNGNGQCIRSYVAKNFVHLSSPGALDGLRIHTEEVDEVLSHITPNTLTVAVVMERRSTRPPILRLLFNLII